MFGNHQGLLGIGSDLMLGAIGNDVKAVLPHARVKEDVILPRSVFDKHKERMPPGSRTVSNQFY